LDQNDALGCHRVSTVPGLPQGSVAGGIRRQDETKRGFIPQIGLNVGHREIFRPFNGRGENLIVLTLQDGETAETFRLHGCFVTRPLFRLNQGDPLQRLNRRMGRELVPGENGKLLPADRLCRGVEGLQRVYSLHMRIHLRLEGGYPACRLEFEDLAVPATL